MTLSCRWLMICLRRLQYVNNDIIIVTNIEKAQWFLQLEAFFPRILNKLNVEHLAGSLVDRGCEGTAPKIKTTIYVWNDSFTGLHSLNAPFNNGGQTNSGNEIQS